MLRPPSDFYECQDSDALCLEVKPSLLPVGQGLFAKRAFKNGDILGEYRGIVIEASYSNNEAYFTEDKMVAVNSKYNILGRTIVAKANDIIKYEPKNYMSEEWKKLRDEQKFPDLEGFQRNAEIQVMEKDRVFLVAIKPIEPGQQIYIAYGFDYWDFFLSRDYEKLHPAEK